MSAVRSISLGGAAVQPELTTRLRRAFTGADRGLSTIYGMTETGGTVASASGQLMAEHPRTSGKPTPVSELRIDFGPGYRLYFVQRGSTVVILLTGGDKRTEDRDIKAALALADEIRSRP